MKDIDDDKITQILLAGLLLRTEPRPDVRMLERLIKVEDGTISRLFPQRPGSIGKKRAAKQAKSESQPIKPRSEFSNDV